MALTFLNAKEEENEYTAFDVNSIWKLIGKQNFLRLRLQLVYVSSHLEFTSQLFRPNVTMR